MLKMLKAKLKYIQYLEKVSPCNNKIIDLKLEVLSIILGYFARQMDINPSKLCDAKSKIDEIVDRLQEFLPIDVDEIFKNRDSLNNMTSYIEKQSENTIFLKRKYIKLLKEFKNGYRLYDYYQDKYDSILDLLILQQPKKLENKIYKIQQKIK